VVVLKKVGRVDTTGCPSGTRSSEGWEPLPYSKLLPERKTRLVNYLQKILISSRFCPLKNSRRFLYCRTKE